MSARSSSASFARSSLALDAAVASLFIEWLPRRPSRPVVRQTAQGQLDFDLLVCALHAQDDRSAYTARACQPLKLRRAINRLPLEAHDDVSRRESGPIGRTARHDEFNDRAGDTTAFGKLERRSVLWRELSRVNDSNPEGAPAGVPRAEQHRQELPYPGCRGRENHFPRPHLPALQV